MAPPHSEPASPYTEYPFGLGFDFQIALIQPFLYFLIRFFPSLFLKSDLAYLAYLAQRSDTNMAQKIATYMQTIATLLLIFIICCASRYHNSKRDKLLRVVDDMDHTEDRSLRAFLKNDLFASSDPVLPPDDYHVTKRQKEMRLLFLVVISALLCPITENVFDNSWTRPQDEWLSRMLVVISVFSQIGVVRGMDLAMVLLGIDLRCLFTAAATVALAFATFGERYGLVDIWDRRLERWVEAFEKERSKATLDEWKILWQRRNLGRSLKAVKDEVDMDERNKELLVWRRGMKEGRGYGPDYWLPREKGPQRPFQYSSVVGEDAYHPRGAACGRDCKGGVRLPFPGFQIHSASNG